MPDVVADLQTAASADAFLKSHVFSSLNFYCVPRPAIAGSIAHRDASLVPVGDEQPQPAPTLPQRRSIAAAPNPQLAH